MLYSQRLYVIFNLNKGVHGWKVIWNLWFSRLRSARHSLLWLLPSDCSHIWEGARIPDVIMCFKQVHRTPHWPHSIVFLFWNGGGCFLLFFIISVSLLGRLLCRDGCVLKNLEDTSSSHFCSSTPALCSCLEGGSRTKIKWLASKMELPQKWVLRTK